MPSTIEDRFGQGQSTAAALKLPCKGVSTTAITFSGEQTIDGVAYVEGDRHLHAPTAASVNAGIWIVGTGAWTRAKDFDGARDVVQGTLIFVAPNTVDEQFWVVKTAGPIYPGTTAVLIEQHTPEELALRADLISSVKAGSATGDGVTSDQVAVAAAVAAAYTAGSDLYWPPGTYLTTATIPNFHDVRHRGPGIVKRGTDLFAVEPVTGSTNVIYIATTGSASNDGLSSSEPINTLTNAWAAIENYGPHLNGKWKIQHAAGTYSGYHRVPYGLSSEKLVELLGPDVSGHPNVPTAIYDNNGAANKVVSCINEGMKVKVKDIKVQECETTAIQMGGGLLVCENVHTLDCYIGIDCAEGTLFVSGGLHDVSAGYATGYARIRSIFNNKHTIGYSYDETTGNPTKDATLAAAPQLVAANVSGRGVHLQEGATGHVYALVEGFAKGLELFSRSRANVEDSDFRLNAVAIEVEFGCDFGGDPPVFNKGTANENTISVRCIGGGMDYGSYASPGTAAEYRVAQNLTGESVTGTTAVETIGGTLYTLTGEDFDEAGSSLRMTIIGTITGTAGTKSIQMRIAGTNVGSVPFVATAVGAFHAEITLRQIASASQVVSTWGISGNTSGAGICDAGLGTATVDIADGVAKAITCSVQLGNAADTIDVDIVELFRIM